jgi:mono/diheme cytochrome c family protein
MTGNRIVKKIVFLLTLIALISFVSNNRACMAGVAISGGNGDVLFKKHCSACHRDAAKLKSTKNLVGKMRNPSAMMPKFDKDKISDREAEEIAGYIHQKR